MTEQTTAAEAKTEVTFSNGLVVWNVDGNIIMGLDKKYFAFEGENPTNEQKLEAKKNFFLYKAQCKSISIILFTEKIERLKEEQTSYENKAANVGKEASVEDKLKAKIAKATKMLADAQEAAKELGVEI
jgi:hypothetical protein